MWERVSAQHRIATALVITDYAAEATWFAGLGHNNPKNSPTVARDGQVYTDIQVRHVLGMEATDPFLELGRSPAGADHLGPTGSGPATTSSSSRAGPTSTTCASTDVTPRMRAWCQQVGAKTRVELPIEVRPTVEVTAASKHRYADYENSGFGPTSTRSTLTASEQRIGQADWQIRIEVRRPASEPSGPSWRIPTARGRPAAWKPDGRFRGRLRGRSLVRAAGTVC